MQEEVEKFRVSDSGFRMETLLRQMRVSTPFSLRRRAGDEVKNGRKLSKRQLPTALCQLKHLSTCTLKHFLNLETYELINLQT